MTQYHQVVIMRIQGHNLQVKQLFAQEHQYHLILKHPVHVAGKYQTER